MVPLAPQPSQAGTRKLRLILSLQRKCRSYVAMRIMWQNDQKGSVSELFGLRGPHNLTRLYGLDIHSGTGAQGDWNTPRTHMDDLGVIGT